MNKAEIIESVCEALQLEDKSTAAQILWDRYPNPTPLIRKGKVGAGKRLRVFLRDGFLDRYSGTPLVLLGALRAISMVIPEAFPYQRNWKVGECHPAFWQLAATVDHVEPVTLGGSNDETNLVTTSMQRNMAKGNFTLEDLDWTLHPPGNGTWDGLTEWFLAYVEDNLWMLTLDAQVKEWYLAAKRQYRTPGPA
jgi:5-methylcytosine-specific restriction endonuclease McrA